MTSSDSANHKTLIQSKSYLASSLHLQVIWCNEWWRITRKSKTCWFWKTPSSGSPSTKCSMSLPGWVTWVRPLLLPVANRSYFLLRSQGKASNTLAIEFWRLWQRGRMKNPPFERFFFLSTHKQTLLEQGGFLLVFKKLKAVLKNSSRLLAKNSRLWRQL